MGFFSSLANLFSGGGKKGAKRKALKRITVDRRFDLIGRTGQGSMSKVWRAYDKELGRTVCLKILDKEQTKKFEARFTGLKRPLEGEICTDLKHKNIVTTYEFGLTEKDEQYLVMELIDGHGLNYLVETRNAQLEGNRLSIIDQLAAAVEYVHKEGYLHRDLCPRNAMVTKDGVVKLIDFGLTIPYTPDFCQPGNRTGTAHYLAPEVIKRQRTDERVDLFALGVTAYEIFTFALPWEGATSDKVLQRHVNIPGKNPKEFKPDLNDRVARFLIRAVERDPKDRYQTAAEFRKALSSLPKC